MLKRETCTCDVACFSPLSSQSVCVCERTPPPVPLPSALWPQCLAEQKRKQLNDGTVCPLAGSPRVWDEHFGRRASLKKDTLLTQQVGQAAGCSGPRRGEVGGRGCDPVPVLQGAWRNLFGHRMAVPIHVYVRLVAPRKASLKGGVYQCPSRMNPD